MQCGTHWFFYDIHLEQEGPPRLGSKDLDSNLSRGDSIQEICSKKCARRKQANAREHTCPLHLPTSPRRDAQRRHRTCAVPQVAEGLPVAPNQAGSSQVAPMDMARDVPIAEAVPVATPASAGFYES